MTRGSVTDPIKADVPGQAPAHADALIIRRLRWGAFVLAVLIALSLPSARIYFGGQTLRVAVTVEAEQLADRLAMRATQAPDHWMYESNALLNRLEEVRRRGVVSAARIFDADEVERAATGQWQQGLLFLHHIEAVLDSGVPIARIEVQTPYAPVIRSAMPPALLGAALGAVTWWLIGIALAALTRTLDQLKSARDEAEAASRARATFLATMSHEIRTPMNGVLGMTSLLMETPLDATQRRYLEVVRASGDSLLAIINDILEFSRAASGKMALEPIAFQPGELAADVLTLLGPVAAKKRIDLLFRTQGWMPEWVLADALRLRQVLMNVVGNAIKFSDAGDVLVTIDTPVPGRLRYRVRDRGIGMSAEEAARIFDAFTQADASTTRRYGGTGLGLAISRQLVEAMDGSIGVESAPGAGSTFTIEIAAAAAEPPPGARDAARPASLAGKRVLVVDDNASHLEIMELTLRAFGIEVHVAGSGEAALKHIAGGGAYDAALVDYDMPQMNGAQLGERLRVLAPGMPLILVSASEGAEKVRDRFDAWLYKPVRRALLVETLGEAIEKARQAPPQNARPSISAPPAVPHAPARATAASGGRPVPASADTPIQVLVVEDNPVNLELARAMLNRCGLRCDHAGNGVEALAAVDSRRYDLIFMDMRMPVMDGVEATRAIRARDLATRPFIVALTANALQEDRIACLDAGMDAVLTKPLRLAEMKACLETFEKHRAGVLDAAV